MKLYLDWQFWTVVISGVALLISSYPYMKARFRKGKLKIDKHRSFFITHRVGTPNINLHLIFKNIGGAPLNIREINLEITKDRIDKFSLSGNGFLINPNDPQFSILTPFELKGDEVWSHTVNFHELWTRKKQHKYRELESKIRDHIQGEIGLSSPEPGRLVVAKEEDIIAITSFFDDNFRWESGEYEVTIIVKDDCDSELSRQIFTFILFESESAEIQSYKNDLKYGFGVHLMPTNRIHGLNIDVTQ